MVARQPQRVPFCRNRASGLADPDLDLSRMEAYLMKLSAATDDFFRFLTDASRR
jgi:hypothetical protein